MAKIVKYGAISILAHGLIIYGLAQQSWRLPLAPEKETSLETYIVPIAQQKQWLASLQVNKQERVLIKEPSKQHEEESSKQNNTTESLTSSVNESEPFELPNPAPQSVISETTSSTTRLPSTDKGAAKKILKINPYAISERVLQRQIKQGFEASAKAHRQAAKAKLAQPNVSVSKQHVEFNQAQVLVRGTNSEIIKWRGQCYVMNENSDMAQAEMPSSGPGPCPGELSADEVLFNRIMEKRMNQF